MSSRTAGKLIYEGAKVMQERIAELEAENTTYRAVLKFVMQIWDGSMQLPVTDLEAWISEARKLLGERIR